MAVRNDFAAGEVLAAADLNDTFAAKADLASPAFTGTPTVNGTAIEDLSGLTFIANGSVTSGSSIIFNNCFTTFRNFRIVVVSNASTSIRLRASGSDAAGSDYNLQYGLANGTSMTAARSNATSWLLTAGASYMVVDVIDPNSAAPTLAWSYAITGGTNVALADFGLQHNVSTAYDGFSVLGSSMTAQAWVYGYQQS